MKNKKDDDIKKYPKKGERAEVIKFTSPLSGKLLDMVRQFDKAYSKMKMQWGESGGVTEEEGLILKEDALNAAREFSTFMNQFCEKVDFKYFPPKGLGRKKKKEN